jgi:hypothetical protein
VRRVNRHFTWSCVTNQLADTYHAVVAAAPVQSAPRRHHNYQRFPAAPTHRFDI